MQLLCMLTSRNLAESSILTSEINPENFRSIISKIGYFTEQSVNAEKSWSVKHRTAHKTGTRSGDLTKFT